MRLVINDLKNWERWDLKGPLLFAGTGARMLEVHFNCTEPATLYVAFGEDKKEKLKLAGTLERGITQVLMTVVDDAFFMIETDGEVWVYDPVGRNGRRQNAEAVSFTGPLNRMARDPNLERYMQVLEATMLNQHRKTEQRLEAQIAELRANQSVRVDPETGEVTEDGPNDAAGSSGGTSGATSGQADSGGEGSGSAPPATGEGDQTADTSATSSPASG